MKRSKRWIVERRSEHFYKRAKREGYRSRAVYKLIQIDSKFKVLRRGDRVVDLGAAPGGWMQYAAEKVGGGGMVLGVDVREIKPLPYSNTKTVKMNVYDEELEKVIVRELRGKADVILSDLSPKITGVWDVDVARSIDLCRRVIRIADRVLERGGNLVLKIFEGRGWESLINPLRRRFRVVKFHKPEASRKRSSEIYAVCLNFRR